jgi:glycosyltransferase involved in cell wall biosynthesis
LNCIVSIITASYNKAEYISETIRSVQNQTVTNWELIIVDDLSTDSTVELVAVLAKDDSRIKLVTASQNYGANYCRNVALKRALGKFIVFLDADDILMPFCLENRVKEIEKNNLDFGVFTMGVFHKTIGDSSYLWKPNSTAPLTDFLQHKLPWSILQPIWKKEFLLKIGGFDENFKRLQDVDLHTRALLVQNVNYKQILTSPDCYYRIDEGRKNFNTFDFLLRRVESSNLYVSKFSSLILDKKIRHFLVGTIYMTYLQILLQFKNKTISQFQYKILENNLLTDTHVTLSDFERFIFFSGKFFYLLPFRIPGINWLFLKMLAS